MTRLQQLRAELAEALAAQADKLDQHDAEAYAQLSDQDAAAYDAECEALETRVSALRRKVNAEQARVESEALSQTRSPIITSDEPDPETTGGFKDFGEFALAVMQANPHVGGARDERLQFMADVPGSTTVNTGSGAEGGFLIPVEYSSRIREYMFGEDSLLPLCSVDTIGGNSMVFPLDETTPWGTSGVRAFWEGEGSNIQRSNLSTQTRSMRLKKLAALVPVTEEMRQDSNVLSTRVPRQAGRAIGWKTSDAIINGSGAGTMLGIRNALNTALITHTKETSQTADTIVAANATKMFARSTRPGGLTWTINPDAWNQLPLMTIGDQPVWLPSRDMQRTPGGMLLGRPVIMTDTMQTLGDAGDFCAIDFAAYEIITKAGGVQTATSMHLWFDYDMVAFRATYRIDGMPAFRNAITPPYSSVTRSPYVQLGART